MSDDLDRLLKGRRSPAEREAAEPAPPLPRLWPGAFRFWAILAVLLVAVSLGIHFLWPLPVRPHG